MKELKDFVEELDNPTFVIATEIRSNKQSLDSENIKLPGYEGPFLGAGEN